jgi:hypothetical protein
MRKLFVAIVLLCLAVPAIAQQSVQLTVEQGSFAPYHPDVLMHGQQVVFSIRVVNQSPEACSFTPSFGWHIYSPDGAQWSGLELVPTSGFDCSAMQIYTGSVDGAVDDSIGIVCPDAVIIDGYDEIAFTLSLQLSTDAGDDGKTIYIDTVGYGGPSGFQWVWSGQGCPDVIPEWLDENGSSMAYGGRSFLIETAPTAPPIVWGPSNVMFSHCSSVVSAQVAPIDPLGYEILKYEITSGPGEIDFASGLWTWGGTTLEDVGEIFPVTITITDEWLRQTTFVMNAIPYNEAPVFTGGYGKSYPVVPGVLFQVPFAATDDCPEDPRTFFVRDDGGMFGECGFTGNVFWVLGDAEDGMSVRIVEVAVTDGVDTSTCTADLYFTCCGPCCGLFTGGYTGNCDCDPEGKRNLSDITALVDNVYLSHTELCCPENGNVDGDVENKTNLSDITRLIDHVYLSKAETALCQ